MRGGAQRTLPLPLSAAQGELLLAEEGLAEHRQLNETLTARLAVLEEQLHTGEMERRGLHNALQELKVGREAAPCEHWGRGGFLLSLRAA